MKGLFCSSRFGIRRCRAAFAEQEGQGVQWVKTALAANQNRRIS